MVKFYLRENMKLFKRFLLLTLFFVPCVCGANVATTAGSNLTAWNGNGGSANNNNWNTLMNNRTLAGAAGAPTADFGNCDAMIKRCAQPKCSACTTLEIARPIVEGCVNSNKDCKKHGASLIDSIAAQIVANANAKMQEQQLAAQQAAASAAAAQNSQQMAQMQQQMQQMQQQMQAQNAQQMQQMQAALDEQKALVAQAQAEAAAAQQAKIDAQTVNASGVTAAQQAAIQSGVSEDVLVRQQITGQVMTEIENAEVALKDLKSTMLTAFEYAGCDVRGNNCTGPKRVKMFKEKAGEFFEPYNTVLDSLYDALIIAQSVGVDITEIYLMLSDSCNSWGEYLCSDTTRYTYNPESCRNGTSIASDLTKGKHPCTVGQVIPAEDSVSCTLQRILLDKEEVQRGMLDPAQSRDAMIRIGCASAIIDSSGLFANRKKQASIDIDTLQRILEQDAPGSCLNAFDKTKKCTDIYYTKYCAVGGNTYAELQRAVSSKRLPKRVCVSEDEMQKVVQDDSPLTSGEDTFTFTSIAEKCNYVSEKTAKQKCYCDSNLDAYWDNTDNKCKCEVDNTVFVYSLARCMSKQVAENVTSTLPRDCQGSGGTWTGADCKCPAAKVPHAVGNSITCVDRMTEAFCGPSGGGEWKDGQCKCSNGVVLVRDSEQCSNTN